MSYKKIILLFCCGAVLLAAVVFGAGGTPEQAARAFLTMAYTVDEKTPTDPMEALARFAPRMTAEGAQTLARNRYQSIGLVRGWQSAEVKEITLTPNKGNLQIWTYEVQYQALESGETRDGRETGFIAMESQNGEWLVERLTIN